MKTVLIIEDSLDLVSLLSLCFVHHFELFFATTYRQASEMINEASNTGKRFDLVLVDGELNDGKYSFDLIPKIKSISNRIVAMSGLPESQIEQMKRGCTERCDKQRIFDFLFEVLH